MKLTRVGFERSANIDYAEYAKKFKPLGLKKITYQSIFKKDPSIVHTGHETTVETVEQFIARWDKLDTFSTHKVVKVEEPTDIEVFQYVSENSAADFYAKYGTEGEF